MRRVTSRRNPIELANPGHRWNDSASVDVAIGAMVIMDCNREPKEGFHSSDSPWISRSRKWDLHQIRTRGGSITILITLPVSQLAISKLAHRASFRSYLG